MRDFLLRNMQPGNLIFGHGACGKIADLLQSECSAKKVLLITDKGLSKLPFTAEFARLISEAGIDVHTYCDISFEPNEHEIATAQKVLDDSFDTVIGLGGGSAMDFAKVISVLVNNKNIGLNDIYGPDKIKTRDVRLILVPTTGGTGSEATINALISDKDNTKQAVISEKLLPDIALLDPRLLESLPDKICATTGMDALCHCLESFISVNSNAVSRAYSYQGCRLIIHNICQSVGSDKSIEARGQMLLGSYLGGLALSAAGTTAVHALAYPLGKRNVAHGTANGMLLPRVMRMNLDACADSLEQLAPLFDIKHSGREAAEEVVERLEDLLNRLPIPKTLSEIGVDESCIDEMAAESLRNERLLKNNPLKITFAIAKQVYLDSTQTRL